MGRNLFEPMPWESGEKPYFINELGNEWYLDDVTNKEIKSRKLKIKLVCFFLRTPEGTVTRIIIDDQQNVVMETTSFEAILYRLDGYEILEKDRLERNK